VRLTLRTLLAYLDDTLEPAQARLIGQKVAESEQAQELMARIKQVTRRRRLTAPPPTGQGEKTDPNLVAEYLDNALPADKLAEFEETCLASDVHLAEIAACHQILTLVLGEPALVPPTSKQRMYALVKGREAIPYRRPAAAGDLAGDGADDHDADETIRMGLPAYRRRGGWPQGVAMLAGGVALVALLAAAIWLALPGSKKTTDTAGNAAADRGRDNQNKKPSRPGKNSKDSRAANGSAKEKGQGGRDGGGEKDGRKTDKEKDGAKDGPRKDKSVAGPGKDGGGERSIPDTEPKVMARFLPPAQGQPRTILVRRGKGETEWQRLEGRNRDISTGDTLVSLPGYRSAVQLKKGLELELWGDLPELSFFTPLLESMVIVHDPRDFDLDLTLDHGMIVLTNRGDKEAKVRVRFANPSGKDGKDYWEITLPKAAKGGKGGSQAGLYLWGRYPNGVPFSKKKTTRRGPESELNLYVLRGEAQVKIDDSTYTMEEPPGPAAVAWNSDKGALGPKTVPQRPDWVNRYPPFPKLDKPVVDGLERQRASMIRALDELSTSMSGVKVEVGLTEALNADSGTWIKRALVIRCFEALGDLSNLLDGLIDPKYPEVRQAAIESLRHWTGLHKDNDLKLHAFLRKKNYSEDDADTILKLLHSFSEEARAKPATYARLVDYLRPEDKPAVRVLAHWHLIRLPLSRAGIKIKYDPVGDSEQVERGYEDWKNLIVEKSLRKRPTQP
jgi:hypothetical protein